MELKLFTHPKLIMFEPFTYKSLNTLKKKIESLNLSLTLSENISVLKQPVHFEDLKIPNRLSIQPMEGFDATVKGAPSELTLRRYKRYANSGAGMIWFEATSILEESRSNPHQLMLTEDNYNDFKKLVSVIRDLANETLNNLGFSENCLLILQLNHSGRYSKKLGKKYPIRIYPNPDLDKAIGVSENDGTIISDEELKSIEEIWTNKAILASRAGFDAVDIKACHGYLISELLNSFERKDSIYGGLTFENRSRFLKNVIHKIHEKNPNQIIATRLGVYDGIPFPCGFGVKSNKTNSDPPQADLTEPIQLIKELNELGVKLFNISAGNPHYKPFITRPYDIPVKNGSIPPEHPLRSVERILNLTSAIKTHFKDKIITISSGFSYLRQYSGYIASGMVESNLTDVCGFGRMAFANPEFAKQLFQKGMIDKKACCITCSKCSQLMREGKNTGCAIRDPLYKEKS